MSMYFFYDTDSTENVNGVTYICPQVYGGYFPHPYKDLAYPDMYLDFCLEDKLHDDIRSRTNAFNNCKKAIHIRIDLILNQYGLLVQNSKCDFPTKLEIVNELELLPTLMLKNINDERNLIEHDYRIPNTARLNEAIDVAELLYMASDRILSNTPLEAIVGYDIEPLHRLMRLEPEKGQLLFYPIELENDSCLNLHRERNIRYINEQYRHIDGSTSPSIIVSSETCDVIDLNYRNKASWKFYILELCHLSKNNRQEHLGRIEGTSAFEISCTVRIPFDFPRESFVDFMMSKIRKRERNNTVNTHD